MDERDVLNEINMELQELQGLLELEQNRVRELVDENNRLNQNLQDRAAYINLSGLHEDLVQMNQQLLRGQAYEQQQFKNIRILQRDNHEAEVLNIRRVEEELRSLFRNENNRPQQGNRDRRENMLPQFLNAPTANRPKKNSTVRRSPAPPTAREFKS
jgi:hypothetical protein